MPACSADSSRCQSSERSSDHSSFYGGSDIGNLGGVDPDPIPWHEQPVSAELTLPPLAGIWLVPEE